MASLTDEGFPRDIFPARSGAADAQPLTAAPLPSLVQAEFDTAEILLRLAEAHYKHGLAILERMRGARF